MLSGASVICTRGRCAGSDPRLVFRFFFGASSIGAVLSCSAASAATRLEILNCQLQLLRIKTFGLAAELGTTELLQQMAKPIVLLHHPLAFCKCRIALAGELSHQSSQAIEIIGESIDRHHRIESDSRSVVLLSNLI